LRRSPTPSQPSARRNAKTIWQTKAIATNDESALVWLWFRNLHIGLAAGMMRISEPPR
jgi:hypothetical protein